MDKTIVKENWLDGPPTKPGLYWFQLQGSAVIRHCDVFEYEGKMVITNPDG